MSEDTQERFLRAIAEQIAPERVVEVHLFSAIRQGPSESRVAVIAADPEVSTDDAEVSTDDPDVSANAAPPDTPVGSPASRRLTIYRARYRLVLKGAERGTWDVNITAEADAPIETVDQVVRGVLRRAGEDAEPERLTGSAFRAVLACEPWTATP